MITKENFEEMVPLSDHIFNGWDKLPSYNEYSVFIAVPKHRKHFTVHVRNMSNVKRFLAEAEKRGVFIQEESNNLTKKQAYDLKDSLEKQWQFFTDNELTARERGQIFKK